MPVVPAPKKELPLKRFSAKAAALGPFLLIAFAAFLSWLIVWPIGNFPLDDDWAYGGAARRLLAEGRLRLSDWSSPWALPHLFTGALFGLFFGISDTVFRLSTLCWGAAGAAFFFQILRERGVPRAVGWLAAGLLFFNPLYFNLCFTFQTDVTFNALAFGALYFFHRAEKGGTNRDEWLFAVFAAAAALTRQIGVALPAAAVCAFAWQRRLTVGRFFRLVALPAAAFLLFYFWLTHVHGPTWAQVNYLTWGTVAHLRNPGPFLWETARRVMESLLYAALFVGPLLLWRTDRPALSAAARWALFFAGACVLAGYLYTRGAQPLYIGLIQPRGLGSLTVLGSDVWKPGVLSSAWFWFLWTGAGAIALAVLWGRCLFNPVGKPEWILLAVGTAPAFCFLAGAKYFDRYTLQWTVGLLIFLPLFKPRARVPFLSWVLLAVMAAGSLIGTRDYFIWNRAKWDLGLGAARFGIAPAEVANGFDWNAHWNYEENMEALRARKPLNKIREWEWEPKNIKAVVTARPHYDRPERLLQTATYYSLLAPRGAQFYLFRRPPGDTKNWGRKDRPRP